MGGKTDKARGRLKEAVGEVMDEPHLKRKGRRDRARGSAKEKAVRAAMEANETVDKETHSRKRTVNLDNM